ncbi:adenylate/guanylate cyclase domain-containing protein [Cyanobium sp. Morenito 9A2]|uniref:adenylate/guanylate cyclase domain-containing protein n=1 Tax=Cyanobium sp. Morenito 9A2 TaxID=2823718 RepID=UPI0020CBD8BD|nr:adenylate/guanylate cyclase domain-containing protein [Cyanobium sp. Morenito 9A2]MCP9850043.1 adenylate/guanylate cyclase domain-containing protein [Cyanobium sp. Morenito 9A2]
MKRSAVVVLASGAIVLLVGGLAGWPPGPWRSWERGLENQLVRWRGPRQPPRSVVVVAIDDATLQQGAWFEGHRAAPAWARGIGTLPWPRASYGQLASRLLEAGAQAVALNVVFEGSSSRGFADDTALARSLASQRGKVALAAEMLEPQDAQVGSGLTLVRPERFITPAGGPGALGLTNTLPAQAGDPDRHPEAYGRGLLPANGLRPQPSLAATLLQLGGRPSRQNDPAMALDFYGPEGTFTRLSAWEVLDPARWTRHPLRGSVKDALVVVGPVASQGEAGNPTPFGNLSGLELLATATANSLAGEGLAPWPTAAPWRALLALAPVLLVAALGFWRGGLGWRLALVGAALALVAGSSFLALQRSHRWLPLLAPASGLVLLGLLYGGDAYLQEERERRRLRRTFERYVAPSVVAEILSDPKAADGILRGRVLRVTVLFSDLKGFTQLTRQRTLDGQSELLVSQLNEYLGEMVEVITAHGGTVDKFIGDAVMAVFGSPVSRGEQQEALAAVRCARAMREALERLNGGWAQRGIEPLGNGVGLATGDVVVGQIGSPRRLDFTVIGDTVNLASRLEGLTRTLEVPVLFDQVTADLVQGELTPESRGTPPVKGMGPTPVFTLPASPPPALS